MYSGQVTFFTLYSIVRDFTICSLVGMWWYRIIFLMSVSLITNEAKCLFNMFIACLDFFFWCSGLDLLSIFSIGSLTFPHWFVSICACAYTYIEDPSPFSVMCLQIALLLYWADFIALLISSFWISDGASLSYFWHQRESFQLFNLCVLSLFLTKLQRCWWWSHVINGDPERIYDLPNVT